MSEHFRCGTGCDCDCDYDYDYDYDLAGNGETCAAPTLTLHSTVVGGNVLHSRYASQRDTERQTLTLSLAVRMSQYVHSHGYGRGFWVQAIWVEVLPTNLSVRLLRWWSFEGSEGFDPLPT